MPLKSVNFLIMTTLYAWNFPNLELIFQLTDTWTPNWSFKLIRLYFSTELVVTLMYTWEEYAGNQSNIQNILLVGSSETTREAP
jgi:hypothetical protein